MSSARRAVVNDLMQRGEYELAAPAGRSIHPDFGPEHRPKEMLARDGFGGKSMTDGRAESPADGFKGAKLCHERHGRSTS